MPAAKFRAGAATTDITPERPLPNYNNSLCQPDTGASPLCCHAVVFDDGETAGAIVAIDATFADRTLLLAIRDECEQTVGVPGPNILVGATHTHAAPASCPSFLSGALPDPAFVDVLIDQAAAAVNTANDQMQPALIRPATCAAPGYERNRRLLRPNGCVVMLGADNADDRYPATGPIDEQMQLLAFTSTDGTPFAIVVNYACHNNCVSGIYHADIGGCIGDALRERYGGNLVTPFLEAPCADTIWQGPPGGPDRGDELARLIGKVASTKIQAALAAAQPAPIDRVVIRSTLQDYPDRPWEDSTFCRDDCRGSSAEMRTQQRHRYDPEEAAVIARGATTCAIELTGISFGDVAIVTNPAELFVEFGIEIKERSPFAVTLVSELTNGYCGYVGPEIAFDQGGYEVQRTVHTCRLSKESGRRMTDASVELLTALHDL